MKKRAIENESDAQGSKKQLMAKKLDILQLIKKEQWESVKQLAHQNLISVELLSSQSLAESDPGKNAIWWMVYHQQWELFELLLNKKLITAEQLALAATASDVEGINAIWMLAHHQQWSLLKKMVPLELITVGQLLINSLADFDKKNALKILVDAQQWQLLFLLILAFKEKAQALASLLLETLKILPATLNNNDVKELYTIIAILRVINKVTITSVGAEKIKLLDAALELFKTVLAVLLVPPKIQLNRSFLPAELAKEILSYVYPMFFCHAHALIEPIPLQTFKSNEQAIDEFAELAINKGLIRHTTYGARFFSTNKIVDNVKQNFSIALQAFMQKKQYASLSRQAQLNICNYLIANGDRIEKDTSADNFELLFNELHAKTAKKTAGKPIEPLSIKFKR